MTWGKIAGWSCCAFGVLLTGACGGPASIEFRAIESASSRIKGGSAALAEAHGLLNLGNPALALEAFRKIQREQPGPHALAGIAACYAAMGRDDLAKTNFEAALAMAPRSVELLHSVAPVMDRLGLKDEAANARVQASQLVATVPAAPPSAAEAAILEKPAAPRADPPPVLAVKADPRPVSPTVDDEPKRTVADPVEEARRFVREHKLSSSVTADLPPARVAAAAGPSVTVKLPPARMASPAATSAPYLERLSRTEVALVTTAKPFWAPVPVTRKQAALLDSRSIRASGSGPNIRLFNAARVQGLAAAARNGLMQRGWRKIEIGDYADVRRRSVVLYPAAKERIGKSLARHFGIGASPTKGETIIVVLGRDVGANLHG